MTSPKPSHGFRSFYDCADTFSSLLLFTSTLAPFAPTVTFRHTKRKLSFLLLFYDPMPGFWHRAAACNRYDSKYTAAHT